MAKVKKCPQCGTQVDAEAEHCPGCPHSWPVEGQGIPESRRGRSVPAPLIWAVLFIAFLFVAYHAINFVIKYAGSDDTSANNPLTRLVASADPADKKSLDPRTQAALYGQAAPARAAQPGEASTPPGPGEDADGEGDGTPVVIGAQARELQEPPSKEWKLRGAVYDLVTLAPVAKATLVFKDAELSRRFEIVTDGQGRYKTIIPSLPDRGYAVVIQHPDYAQSYLNPGTEHVAAKPASERREMAQELTRSLDAPYSVQGLGKRPVETDFYLAPLKSN